MGAEDFKHGVFSILLAFALVFSMISVAPLASSGNWVNDPAPGGTIIQVMQGENLVIRHVLEWDESQDGAYTVTIWWINYDNEPSENLTFLSAEAYFTTGPNAGEQTQADVMLASAPSGSDTNWALSVQRPPDNRDPRNGQFNVDIWMGAYGVGGVPHIQTDNHPILEQFSGIIVFESGMDFWNRAPITIKVLEPVPVVRGVEVAVEPEFKDGPPSTWLEYTVTVTNTGNVDDNYDLSVSDNEGWGDNIWLDDNTLTVPASENRTTTLHVHIPDNAIPCTRDNITVTATSTENSQVSAENSCIAHVTVTVLKDVEVSISPPENSGIPEETLTYTVTVTNTGNVSDSYNLEVSDNADWSPTPSVWPTSLSVPIGESRTATLTVIIPDVGDVSSGEEDEITVTATSTENAEISGTASCIARAVFVRGVEVSVSPPENSGIPGENVTFTVTVINTGDIDDSYNLSAIDNADWDPIVSPTWLGTFEAGSSDNATLIVIIPDGTASGMEDEITVTATSTADPTVSDSTTCIATAATMRGVDVSISPPENSWVPGENVTFTVTVINTGNVTDNYALTVGDNAGWALSLPDNLLENVGLGEDNTATLTVKIPENALPGEEDEITVTAKSTADPMVHDNASCIARAVVGGVEVSISPSEDSAPPGENVTFTVTVKNTGEAEDNYDLTISDDAGWALLLPDNLLKNIGPGENDTATLTVKIPENALPGEEDEITVTATSQMYPVEVTDSASCLSNVFIVRGVDVDISPGSKSGTPGENVTFTVTVKNTGEADDSYDLTISDDAGWGATLDNSSLSISFGGSRTTTVRVTVPSDAIGNESTEITVTATSVENENASENATCIATTTAVMGVEVSISPPENSGPPGRTLTFTVTVKNTGNVEDNYSLAASDNADWHFIVSPTSLTILPKSDESATLTVTILDEAPSGEEDEITVTATSNTDPTLSGNASCIASAVVVRGMEVSVSPPENSGAPGEIVSFTVTIINKGNIADSYKIEASDDAGWNPTAFPASLPLAAGATGEATLTVTIHDNASLGEEDEITVTATSNTDPTVSGSVTCIATAATIRRVKVYVSPENQSGAPGETLTFTVTVKNTGNVSDNYDLTADDNTNWSLTLPETLTDVIPGESRTVNLSVGISDDAENSTRDNVTVTVTSRADTTVKNSASCTAHAVALPLPPEHGVQVLISPDDQRGSPWETLTFTVTVKNKGDVEDNYDLTISDDAGWGATLDKNLLTIPAGGNRTTRVRVTVPSDADADESTQITVVATSRGDPTVSDSGISRAIAEGAPGGPGVEIPIPLAISVFLIGATILVIAYLLRRRPKKARGSVLRDVSFGFR